MASRRGRDSRGRCKVVVVERSRREEEEKERRGKRNKTSTTGKTTHRTLGCPRQMPRVVVLGPGQSLSLRERYKERHG